MRYLLFALSIVFLASCGKGVEGLTPEEYISENNLQATELEDGVYIVIHDEGNEVRPALNKVVDVDYTGTLTDGMVFSEVVGFKTLLSSLIPGWQIGLKEIGEGGACTLIIPYEMGFGDVENGPVPARSTLIFDVTLNNVYTTRTIDEYIADNSLETVELDKGVRIAVHEIGSDVRPNGGSKVTVNYIGKLTNELIFDQGQNVKFDLANLIEGWRIGLQEIGEGGSCTLVLPADVAYGSDQVGIIPADSPLVFELDLIKVE